ncbi:MAG: PQQ-dependent sugar dehydrogenase [Gammaproteobacteria bacterium]
MRARLVSAVALTSVVCTGAVFAQASGVPLPIRGELPGVTETFVQHPPGIEVTSYATGLEIVWSLAFAPDGRLFIAERPGRIRVVDSGGVLDQEPWLVIPGFAARFEDGLLGLTLDPAFAEQPWVYAYYTTDKDGVLVNRVSRFREVSGRGGSEQILLDDIPSGRIHNGGRLRFGPDGMLYVTTGDTFEAMRAQNTRDLGGKILRIASDGAIPTDNPFPGSPVWAFGVRSSHGLAFRPADGALFAADNGPSTEWPEQFIRARDELNVIEKGANYGWPIVVGAPGMPQFTDPLLAFAPQSVPPGDLMFYDADAIPGLRGDLLLSSLAAQAILRIRFEDTASPNRPTSIERWFNNGEPNGAVHGRLRGMAVGPDGAIYVGTGNRDGRAALRDGDDQVLRIALAGR